jgi:predicted DNA-binding protein YlxM (UPF0122 family)
MKAIFKFNNGNGALLCNCCSGIIKTGSDFSDYEREAMIGDKELVPQFCKDCKIIVRMAINMAHAYEVRNYLDIFTSTQDWGVKKAKEGLCFYLYQVKDLHVKDIAHHLRINQSTVYKYVKNYSKLFDENLYFRNLVLNL